MKKFLLFKFLIILFSFHSLAQHSWNVNITYCSTIEVSTFDLNRSDASVLLYEKNNGFYSLKQSMRFDTAASSVAFSDLPNSIYRTVIIFDQKYEGEYTLWNASVNTSADIQIDCLQFRGRRTALPVIKLVPNPATNIVNIVLDDNVNEIINAKIFSSNGKLVKQFSFAGLHKEVNLEDIPSGHYVIQFLLNNTTITEKLVKI